MSWSCECGLQYIIFRLTVISCGFTSPSCKSQQSLHLSPVHTVAEKCDSLIFLRQCGQAIRLQCHLWAWYTPLTVRPNYMIRVIVVFAAKYSRFNTRFVKNFWRYKIMFRLWARIEYTYRPLCSLSGHYSAVFRQCGRGWRKTPLCELDLFFTARQHSLLYRALY